MGKKRDLSDFDRGMIVGARQGGLSNSEMILLGFSHTTVSRVCREWCVKQKPSSDAAVLWAETCLVNERGQRRGPD